MTPSPSDQQSSPNETQEPIQRVAKRMAKANRQPTPLAFTIDEQHPKPTYILTVAQWSQPAQAYLQKIEAALGRSLRLPIVSLRGYLNVADQQLLRFASDFGIYHGVLLWTLTGVKVSHVALNDAVLRWLVNELNSQTYISAAGTDLDALKDLARRHAAVETAQKRSTPFHWGSSQSNTAKALHQTSFVDLADYVAVQLEGKALFPELPGLRRIIGNDLEQAQAELMTEPIVLGRTNPFSLVVRVRVFSYPGRSLPLVTIEFTRRTWARKLNATSGVQTISGYALPDHSTHVLRFTLRKVQNAAGQWDYETDRDFAPIERQYFSTAVSVSDILQNGRTFVNCKTFVVQKHGTGGRGDAKNGVPDLDKLDAFGQIAQVLAPQGLQPWHGLARVTSSARDAKDYNQHWQTRNVSEKAEQERYASWLQEAQESIRTCYQGTHHLVIGVQPDPEVEADAIVAEQLLNAILPESIVITRIQLPASVHGPRGQLPGTTSNSTQRAALRAQAWGPFLTSIQTLAARSGHKVDGVLVLAREWYADKAHDDLINKRVARITLAKGAGAPVQYLRPRAEAREAEEEANKRKQNAGKGAQTPEQIEASVNQKFETRLMQAWLDLAFKSFGRVRPAKLLDEVHKIYDTTPPSTYPDHILALGIIRRNKRRKLANEPTFLPYAIELDVEKGVCSASFAYEDPATHQLALTEVLPLPQALVRLASLGVVHLASTKTNRQQILAERGQLFFKDRLAEFGRRATHPLVLIDANTSRSIWPWLQDQMIDPANIALAGGFNEQATWPHARMVRIRLENSPKVLWDKEFSGVTSETGETIWYRAPHWAEAQLFRFTDTTNTSLYLSFGSAIRLQRIRGRSCYRTIHGLQQKKEQDNQGRKHTYYQVAMMPPFLKTWATPVGVEIYVVRSNGDEPDAIARTVEWLRQCFAHYGAWTDRPAPLFFESVLKEYLPDYGIDDEQAQIEEEEEQNPVT